MTLAFLFTLVGVAIGVALFFLGAGTWTIATLLFFMLFLYCLVELVISIFSPERSLASVMFWFFWSFMVLLPGAAQTSADQYFFEHSLEYTQGLQLKTALVLAVFLILFSAARRFFYVAAGPGQRGMPNTKLNPAVTLLIAILTTTISWTMILSYGYSYFADSDASFLDYFDPITYNLFIVLPRALLTASIYLTAILIKEHKAGHGALGIFCGSIVLLTIQLAMYNYIADPTSVTRYITLSFAVTLLLIIVHRETTAFKGASFALMVMFLFTVFPALRLIRYGGSVGDLLTPEAYLFHGDLDGFQSMMNIVALVAEKGEAWGSQIASAMLFFAPRSLWPNKSVGTGDLGAQFAGYLNFNVSSPLPIEAYADFGIVGMMIAAVLLAKGTVYLDRSLVGSEYFTIRYYVSAVVTGFLMIVMRGSLIGVIAPPVCTAGAVWISLRLGSYRKLRNGPFSPLSPSRSTINPDGLK